MAVDQRRAAQEPAAGLRLHPDGHGRSRPSADWDDILPGSYDGTARVKVLDEEGIERSVLYPSLYLLHGDIEDVAVAAAACAGYNRWIADMCRDGKGRLDAVGIVPLQSIEHAAAEVEHIAKLGLKGVSFRPERYRGLALSDERLKPFWQRIAANGLFVVHGSFGSLMPSFASSRYENNFFVHMICHPFEQMAAALDIITGGVLERHPGLRVAFLESGLGWLEYWLERMDEHWVAMRHAVPWLTRKPSDLFREQCFISVEADEDRPPAAPPAEAARSLRLLGRRLSPLRLHLSGCGQGARREPGAARRGARRAHPPRQRRTLPRAPLNPAATRCARAAAVRPSCRSAPPDRR